MNPHEHQGYYDHNSWYPQQNSLDPTYPQYHQQQRQNGFQIVPPPPPQDWQYARLAYQHYPDQYQQNAYQYHNQPRHQPQYSYNQHPQFAPVAQSQPLSQQQYYQNTPTQPQPQVVVHSQPQRAAGESQVQPQHHKPQQKHTHVEQQHPHTQQQYAHTQQQHAHTEEKSLRQSHAPSQQRQTTEQPSADLQRPKTTPRVVIESKPTPVITPELPVDYRLLLLSLSEQYIREARALGMLIAHNREPGNIDLYYKLVATGLGCMESVLKNYTRKLPPRQEALIRFRYAALLFEETDDESAAETLLTKGVGFCDQHRLLDLKYSMQHLLTRVLFKSRPKTAFKYLDKALEEALVCQHVVWTYSFRFLRVSLLMQLASQHDINLALQNLRAISDLSSEKKDRAIYVVAAVLEALVCLRSRDGEASAEAQRALASARAQQLNEELKETPQLPAMLHMTDLACSLNPYDAAQSKMKAQTLNNHLDAVLDEHSSNPLGKSKWLRDGSFHVPINHSKGSNLTLATGGLFTRDANGVDCLAFSWLARPEAYLLAYLLAAVALSGSSRSSDSKTEQYIKEGLKMSTDDYQMDEASNEDPLNKACSKVNWRRTIRSYLLLHLTFSQCNRSDWQAAEKTLSDLHKALEAPGLQVTDQLHRFSVYLTAVVQHGLGDLDAALKTYQSDPLRLPDTTTRAAPTSELHETLAILALLNSTLIVRPADHPSHKLLSTQLDRLAPYFTSPSTTSTTPSNRPPNSSARRNPHLASAYHYLTTVTLPSSSSATSPSTPIVATKNALQRALNLAKSAANDHLTTLILNYMCAVFFRGIVGPQAEKAARAARATAHDAGSALWSAVADGMLADVLEREGRPEEGRRAREEGARIVAGLPSGLRDAVGAATAEEQGGGGV